MEKNEAKIPATTLGLPFFDPKFLKINQ